MKEIKEIIHAFDIALREEKKTALATVVYVDGSSYRRPGARMLITEDGELTGAISGGCLEGDALKKAQLVIFQQKPMLVTYDTRDEDDAKFGVGLGCNGLIHVLIEPIHTEMKNHPLALLKKCLQNRENKILVTFFNLQNKRDSQLGTQLLLEEGKIYGEVDGSLKNIKEEIFKDSRSVFTSQKSWIKTYEETDNISAFLELVKAPLSLLVVGAGNDAIPLVKFAHVLGWEITMIDGRVNYLTRERFPFAHHLLLAKAEEALTKVILDKRTVIVLMTHNFNYEMQLLSRLIPVPIPYIGMLGPKKKLEKMIQNLGKNGVSIEQEDRQKIFGPIGLNIGAEAPEEIALSIIAEIQAVLSGEKGTFLREKEGPIHALDTGNFEIKTIL